jgi:hypothetical protein
MSRHGHGAEGAGRARTASRRLRRRAGRGRTRSGVSLVEIIIAMTIALIVSGVMLFAYITNLKNVDRGVQILDYLRKATILLERVKHDIRAAVKDKSSVDAAGPNLTVKRHATGDTTVTIRYRYDVARRVVERLSPSERATFGTGGRGLISHFSVTPVKTMPGFYKIEVVFETITDAKPGPGPGAADAGSTKRSQYTFHSLVNKRSPEDTDRDIQWHSAYE